jgi:ring-1,2-phenylacetyl-CoA epoxidase subunit PaaB
MTDPANTQMGDAPTADHQWPVYQVFERPSRSSPMQAAGSVHAADPEMALQSARDVYGRRPTSVGLWVVPRTAVFSKTTEELQDFSPAPDDPFIREQTYCVFRKTASRVVYEETKPVRAATPEQALIRAVMQESNEQQTGERSDAEEIHAWWVFPSLEIISSESTSGELSFKPQPNKWFRDQKSFPVLAMLRQLRAARKREEADDEDAGESE